MKNNNNDAEYTVSDGRIHLIRNKVILRLHPDIKKLMKIDPLFKWICLAIVIAQFSSFYLLRNCCSFWVLFTLAYCINGVANHALLIAIHEFAHNRGFGHRHPLANKLFSIFINLPLGIPEAIAYRRHHFNHHHYLSVDRVDTDVPMPIEEKFNGNCFLKILWLILLPIFFFLRSLVAKKTKPASYLEHLNMVIQFLFNLIIGKLLGWNIVLYMIGSTLLVTGLHPLTGRSLTEHFDHRQFKNERINGIKNEQLLIPAVASYYGKLNWVSFNVGYHVEHHDFPSISARYLPRVRKIAPEFYDNLPSASWLNVFWKFIVDPEFGPVSRGKQLVPDLN
jgi:sphingolipid 4-desaturase/C4-monooxygenase